MLRRKAILGIWLSEPKYRTKQLEQNSRLPSLIKILMPPSLVPDSSCNQETGSQLNTLNNRMTKNTSDRRGVFAVTGGAKRYPTLEPSAELPGTLGPTYILDKPVRLYGCGNGEYAAFG
ncbi:hypothetical protein VTL71DRAFT_2812 [Oculimacula yallundae]|uniref:Uncharacterized protein n=1 Tax=Oculimacula yallundae TaxID=86028 RepID=A0ABR4C9Y3_9HELO